MAQTRPPPPIIKSIGDPGRVFTPFGCGAHGRLDPFLADCGVQFVDGVAFNGRFRPGPRLLLAAGGYEAVISPNGHRRPAIVGPHLPAWLSSFPDDQVPYILRVKELQRELVNAWALTPPLDRLGISTAGPFVALGGLAEIARRLSALHHGFLLSCSDGLSAQIFGTPHSPLPACPSKKYVTISEPGRDRRRFWRTVSAASSNVSACIPCRRGTPPEILKGRLCVVGIPNYPFRIRTHAPCTLCQVKDPPPPQGTPLGPFPGLVGPSLSKLSSDTLPATST